MKSKEIKFDPQSIPKVAQPRTWHDKPLTPTEHPMQSRLDEQRAVKSLVTAPSTIPTGK